MCLVFWEVHAQVCVENCTLGGCHWYTIVTYLLDARCLGCRDEVHRALVVHCVGPQWVQRRPRADGDDERVPAGQGVQTATEHWCMATLPSFWSTS